MAVEISPTTYEELKRLGVATVYEASGGVGALDTAIKPVWHGARACGPAYTVRCPPGDNLAIHRCLEFVSPGEVLVVQNGGLLGGYWGGILTEAALARGVDGLVIDGGCRDVADLERLQFPVFARGLGVFRTVKHEPGELNAPLVVGGVLVRPGDVMLGDGDGVMAIARERVDEALDAARKREEHERHIVDRIHKGELTIDIYGWRR